MPTSLSRLKNPPRVHPTVLDRIRFAPELRERGLGQVLLEELLDLRHVRAPVDAGDHTPVDHEHERWNVHDSELLEQARMLVGVHAPDAQPVAVLALDVSEEALHATRGTG